MDFMVESLQQNNYKLKMPNAHTNKVGKVVYIVSSIAQSNNWRPPLINALPKLH